LSAYAQSAAAATTYSLRQNKAQLIHGLETAKGLDWANALDPNVAPVTQEDFLDQMNKADRAIKELTHGFEVPQSEIEDVLWSPPKSISLELRFQLIRQFKMLSEATTAMSKRC
jgi:hypothetical protein